MIARRTARPAIAVVVVAALSSACVRENTTPALRESATPVSNERQFEFGARRVKVTVPAGWEPLDQGTQKRFRKGEFEIVLQDLGSRTPPGDPAAPAGAASIVELIDWGLAEVGEDQRREVKSRRPVTLDGREAMDIETWQRLDHTSPRRIFFVNDDGNLLALHTVRMAFKDSLAAFDALRDSLHFVSIPR